MGLGGAPPQTHILTNFVETLSWKFHVDGRRSGGSRVPAPENWDPTSAQVEIWINVFLKDLRHAHTVLWNQDDGEFHGVSIILYICSHICRQGSCSLQDICCLVLNTSKYIKHIYATFLQIYVIMLCQDLFQTNFLLKTKYYSQEFEQWFYTLF